MLFLTCKSEEIQIKKSSITSIYAVENVGCCSPPNNNNIEITRAPDGLSNRIAINRKYGQMHGPDVNTLLLLEPIYENGRLKECMIDRKGIASTFMKFEYSKGRIAKISSGNITDLFEYDRIGRLSKKVRRWENQRIITTYSHVLNKTILKVLFEHKYFDDSSEAFELKYQETSNPFKNDILFLIIHSFLVSPLPAFAPIDFYFNDLLPESIFWPTGRQKNHNGIYDYNESGDINSIQTNWADWTLIVCKWKLAFILRTSF